MSQAPCHSALEAAGAETTTLLPGYPTVLTALADAETVYEFADLFGGPATVLRCTAATLNLLVVDAPHLFARAGNPYVGADGAEWPDNGVRFAGLGAVAGALGVGLVPGLTFDIVHAHDWQAAMAAVYLRFHNGTRPATVLTVHNLAFQGRYPASLFPRLGLPDLAFGSGWIRVPWRCQFPERRPDFSRPADNRLSHLCARDHEAGEWHGPGRRAAAPGRGAIRHHERHRRYGLESGDRCAHPGPILARRRLASAPSTRPLCSRRLGLNQNPDAMLTGVVSRLTSQKGLDMLLDQLDEMVADGMQLALLGSGDPHLEHAFVAAAGIASRRGRMRPRLQ